MNLRLILCLAVLVFFSDSDARPLNLLKPFITDNCTMFVDGTRSRPDLWKSCCIEHDLRYWFGGSLLERSFSDKQLKSCVTKKAGTFYANILYYGISAGHYSPIKHKYQWGWGWDNQRERFSSLSDYEKEIINSQLDKLDFTQEYLEKFKNRYQLK